MTSAVQRVLAIVVVVVVVGVGCRKKDACERAIERLDRIAESKGHTTSQTAKDLGLDACRNNPKARTYDPVLQCALNSKTDEQADACIEQGLKEVLKPGSGSGGKGLNPLLSN